jgi:hypothetical protein
MQIVIDIPKEQYSLIMQSYRSGVARFIDKEAMMYAIKNGIPLDKIRAEIEEQKECRCFDDDDMFVYITGLNDAIYIIDKYKAESEDKE